MGHSQLSALQRLERIGFRRAGRWCREESGELRCEFADPPTLPNILYAFVSEGTVLYIGKSVGTLKRRLYGYAKPAPSQSTNIKGNQRILEALAANRQVDVFALPDNGLLHYGGFHINLAAGLEDSLIQELRPPWNGRGMSPEEE